MRRWVARRLRTLNTSTVKEICHANGSTLVPAGGKCERREGPSAIADLGGIRATYEAHAHEIVDAITAAVTRAQAGLNWLRAEPPDLEEVRQLLNFIASDGKRAAEIVIRLQALIEKVPTVDDAADP